MGKGEMAVASLCGTGGRLVVEGLGFFDAGRLRMTGGVGERHGNDGGGGGYFSGWTELGLAVILSAAKNPQPLHAYHGLGILRRGAPQNDRRGAAQDDGTYDHSVLRSTHLGFSDSMRATFLYRFHPFICFSRAIAD